MNFNLGHAKVIQPGASLLHLLMLFAQVVPEVRCYPLAVSQAVRVARHSPQWMNHIGISLAWM
jgi:hypothetical protein